MDPGGSLSRLKRSENYASQHHGNDPAARNQHIAKKYAPPHLHHAKRIDRGVSACSPSPQRAPQQEERGGERHIRPDSPTSAQTSAQTSFKKDPQTCCGNNHDKNTSGPLCFRFPHGAQMKKGEGTLQHTACSRVET